MYLVIFITVINMGHFKAKRRNNSIKKYFFFLLIIFIIFAFIKISKNYRINSDILKKITLTYLSLNEEKKVVPVMSSNIPKEIIPSIYIYNSHQKESYSYNKVNSYNIDNTVLFASYILSSYLDNNAYVESEDITKMIHDNDYTYSDSYKVSRMLMERRYKENSNLKYYIDLHRDSTRYDYTTCNIDGINYAKIMFIIGLENDDYESNLEFTNKINEKLLNYNSCLSRGILKKEGVGVNGVYNQDFSSYAILIEVGGVDNTIDEVSNTLEVFANIYKQVLNDEN